MKFSSTLLMGTLLKRYKRFLADVQLDSGEILTAHTANPGSMRGLVEPGNPVALSHHPGSSRKLPYSLELISVGSDWVGVNTLKANPVVEEALRGNKIPELSGYDRIRREVCYGESSRVDFLLEGEKQACYVEVKSVTLVEGEAALFPDAVTERGRKHLHELEAMVKAGHRAVMLFVVQRGAGKCLSPADEIDPRYGEALRQASRNGVEVLAYRAGVTPEEISLAEAIPVELKKGHD